MRSIALFVLALALLTPVPALATPKSPYDAIQDHYVFFGAVWHPQKPTWLRIATRALALPGDAYVHAEMMAETKPGSVPVLLERVATV